jgi:hypothetical protein
LSDANRRRPSAIFAETFAELSALAAGVLPRHGKEVLRLIDATPIPLTSLHKWAQWNGRTRGLKGHVVYDPDADRPVRLEITAATVNDVVVGRDQPIEPGVTYVFDSLRRLSLVAPSGRGRVLLCHPAQEQCAIAGRRGALGERG